MKKPTNQIVIALLLLGSLGFSLFASCGCTTTTGGRPTANATVFTTLKAAAAAIDAYRAEVEVAKAEGLITAEQWAEFSKDYNQANDAIIDAAILLRDVGGLDAASPESVNAAVVALAKLTAKIIPPKQR